MLTVVSRLKGIFAGLGISLALIGLNARAGESPRHHGGPAGFPDSPTATNGQHERLTWSNRQFTLKLAKPETFVAVCVVGVPASGDNPQQAFSSCAELPAFAEEEPAEELTGKYREQRASREKPLSAEGSLKPCPGALPEPTGWRAA